MEEVKNRHDNMPAELKALLAAGRSFSEATVKDEEIAAAERTAEDPFKYEWDNTIAGWTAKVIEFYWPVIATMIVSVLLILFVQFLSYFVSFHNEAIALGWWCVLPTFICMLVAAYAQHWNVRTRYFEYTQAQRQVNELRHRQSKQLAHQMARYLESELETMDRRHNDLKSGVEAAVHTQEGTIPLRPADQLAALRAVCAFLKDEEFPAAVATITRAEYNQFYADRQVINPTEYARCVKNDAYYQKHWPQVAEALRVIAQKLWDARREGSDPPSAEARREIVRIVKSHWGEESYAWCFLRDLGATKDA